MAGVRITDMTETPDATAGDRRALETFFADHYGRLVGLAGLVCGDITSAEDIVQTALERAWRSRHAILDDARMRPWLDRIVVREAARERRSRLTWLGRVIRPPTVTRIETPFPEVVDLAAGRFPERLALRQAFAGLSRAHRAVVVLVLDAGYSIDEAAEDPGRAPGDRPVATARRPGASPVRAAGGRLMEHHVPDEQLDRAIVRFLRDRREEIELSAMSALQAASRVAVVALPRGGLGRRMTLALLLTLMVALVATALLVGSQLRLPSPVLPIPPDREVFTPTGSMAEARWGHTATLLTDGRVLVVGGSPVGRDGVRVRSAGAEVWDPVTGSFGPTDLGTTGTEPSDRVHHTATLLDDGRVLIVAGGDGSKAHPGTYTVVIWDPESGTASQTRGVESRHHHTATLLPGGRVLVIGGTTYDGSTPDAAETWDPIDGTWSPSGSLLRARGHHTATLLPDGRVLVAGGFAITSDADGNQRVILDSTELWDPVARSFSPAGGLVHARADHTVLRLADGRVLVIGGSDDSGPVLSVERWDPATDTFSVIGSLDGPIDTATLLADGRVLLIGGASADIWDPVTGTTSPTRPPIVARSGQTATLLPDGRVLVVGGDAFSSDPGVLPVALASAELFGLGGDAAAGPSRSP